MVDVSCCVRIRATHNTPAGAHGARPGTKLRSPTYFVDELEMQARIRFRKPEPRKGRSDSLGRAPHNVGATVRPKPSFVKATRRTFSRCLTISNWRGLNPPRYFP